MKPLVLPERFRLLLILTACILVFAQSAHADGPSITTGLGYKPMVQQLCAAYAQQSGVKPTEMYSGNIGQIIEQAKAGSGVSIIVSEKGTLQDSGLAFAAVFALLASKKPTSSSLDPDDSGSAPTWSAMAGTGVGAKIGAGCGSSPSCISISATAALAEARS